MVDQAKGSHDWDLGNTILYDMCKANPLHADVPCVIAKVWLIGRSYAAAIERGRKKKGQSDEFYVQVVGPTIVDSEIDSWIGSAKRCKGVSRSSIDVTLDVHHRTTKLLKKISSVGKRSLASKYLHFHVPEMFYLFDTRALKALRTLSSYIGSVSDTRKPCDEKYGKFARRCLALQERVEADHSEHLSPRQLDNLLLQLHSAKNPRTGA